MSNFKDFLLELNNMSNKSNKPKKKKKKVVQKKSISGPQPDIDIEMTYQEVKHDVDNNIENIDIKEKEVQKPLSKIQVKQLALKFTNGFFETLNKLYSNEDDLFNIIKEINKILNTFLDENVEEPKKKKRKTKKKELNSNIPEKIEKKEKSFNIPEETTQIKDTSYVQLDSLNYNIDNNTKEILEYNLAPPTAEIDENILMAASAIVKEIDEYEQNKHKNKS